MAEAHLRRLARPITCPHLLTAGLLLGPTPLMAASVTATGQPLVGHWIGIGAIVVFVAAYALVVTEEFTHMRKSAPVLVAAGLMWLLVAGAARDGPSAGDISFAARESLLSCTELLLFLLVAMTYVNAMTERAVFAALRSWLLDRGTSYRGVYWLTGGLSFLLSAFIDNLTTALVMAGVVLAMSHDRRVTALCCVNIVVASNAGGAWSAFGDITSLMVWQAGKLEFTAFLRLFPPALATYLVPAALVSLAVPVGSAGSSDATPVRLKPGGAAVVMLFALTLLTAVVFQRFLGLPPVMGMMLGLGYLKILGYALRNGPSPAGESLPKAAPLDTFRYVAQVEWDTLLFFYGVILCVGALAAIGYLELASAASYQDLGPTRANILVGVASAVIDNIPIMAAVIQMNPAMSQGEWLLITLTAGVGGSMLSIGSAAGVALMGQARGQYTFFHHLPWTPAIALGYAAGVWVHLFLNKAAF